jgi:hypothetical protein
VITEVITKVCDWEGVRRELERQTGMTAPRLILRLCILIFSLSLNEVLAPRAVSRVPDPSSSPADADRGVGSQHRQAQDLIIENFETSP